MGVKEYLKADLCTHGKFSIEHNLCSNNIYALCAQLLADKFGIDPLLVDDGLKMLVYKIVHIDDRERRKQILNNIFNNEKMLSSLREK